MLAVLRFTAFILGLFFCSTAFCQPVVSSAASNVTCCAGLEESKEEYLKDNRYAEFIGFLENLKGQDKLIRQPCFNYYKALTRYLQLKYLEEKQSWDEYFAEGNTYRDQITENAQKVIVQTQNSDCLRPRARLLLWQFHCGQQDAFTAQSLTELMDDVNAYAGQTQDAALVKEVADNLSLNGEKSKARQLYKLYVEKLVSGKISDAQLKETAEGFYKENNLDLAEAVYDIYIEKISKSLTPDKLIPELFQIAEMFAYKASGPYDMAYAEKIYEKIEGWGQKNVFDQDTIYLRACNLEKMKDYKKAAALYSQLVQLYPDTRHFDEAVYKVAMINAYVLADIKEARAYFEKLITKSTVSPQVISSFYQLGLLAQWEGNLNKAKSYYEALIDSAGDKQPTTVRKAQERLDEIAENKSLNYNLKKFLDLSFNKGDASLGADRSELKSSGYILGKGQEATVSSFAAMPASGCNQVELQYLWSGNLGSGNPGIDSAGFQGAYPDPGTKEINLIIITSAGILDHSFIMIDVY
ncbi:MAG: tetratricopeptide repeat protein [Candidatus Omnitrophica bacterium]|nr:tetratricopeptide repeat protein [Candidatus Omnitrophota bacterium]